MKKAVIDVYTSTADELVKRITDLISDHPEILTLDDVWKLFKIKGFYCEDLGPSLFQAQWAPAKAKKDWMSKRRKNEKDS